MYRDQSMNLKQASKLKTVFWKMCVCSRANLPQPQTLTKTISYKGSRRLLSLQVDSSNCDLEKLVS